VFLHMRQGGGRHIYSDEGGVASASRENDGRGIASCVCSAGAQSWLWSPSSCHARSSEVSQAALD
jgi:hypothetical protein